VGAVATEPIAVEPVTVAAENRLRRDAVSFTEVLAQSVSMTAPARSGAPSARASPPASRPWARCCAGGGLVPGRPWAPSSNDHPLVRARSTGGNPA
jgi:hypothetical protein